MNALNTILIVILSIGLTQGVIFGIIVWRKSESSQANKYKGILLLLLSYGLLNQVLRLFDIGYYDTYYHLTLDLNWSYGPLLYLYVKAQVTPDFKFSKKYRWLLLPLLIQVICSIYVRSQNFYWDGTRESLTWLGYWGYHYWMNFSSVPIIASILIIYFSIKSLRLLNQLPEHDVIEKNLRWVKNLVIGFAAYYALVLVILITDLSIYMSQVSIWYFYHTRFFYYPFFIGMAVLLYWFGISSVLKEDQRVLKVRKKLSISELESLEEIAEKLQIAMKVDLTFKDPELTVTSLAEKLSIKSYLLTKTLNEVLHKSFTDYVNEFRVAEVDKLVNDPSNDKFTLLSLAYEAGFNSKSSFNRAVQKHLGIAPSQLKRNN